MAGWLSCMPDSHANTTALFTDVLCTPLFCSSYHGWLAVCLACPNNQPVGLLSFPCVGRIQQSSSVSRNNQSISALDLKKLREKRGMQLTLYSSSSYHGWLAVLHARTINQSDFWIFPASNESSNHHYHATGRACARLIVNFEN